MKASSVPTAIFALFPLSSLLVVVGDGGNVDFYRFPLTIAWLLLTAFALFWSKTYSRILAFIGRAWWLQLMVPFVLFALSVSLANFYMPHPWPKHFPPAAAAPADPSNPGKRP